jgi:serine/threonine-protein kinase
LKTYGNFELLTLLTRGGMAEVYLARQRGEGRFERLVVIKQVLPELASDATFIELFLEEARIAALLDHPNVMPTYDFGRVDETYFIAMPHVVGLTLLELLQDASRRRVPVPLAVSCEIMRQALAGLHYVHERRGLDGTPLEAVHRDLTPTNLMLDDQGRVLVLDFGIAATRGRDLLARARGVSPVRGKLPYMSPEQIRGQPLDRRSDLFSMGINLYELTVGRRLFQRPGNDQVRAAILGEPLPELPGRLPAALAQLIRRSLERDRERRPDTAAEMRATLEEVVRAGGLPAGPAQLHQWFVDNFAVPLQARVHRVRRATDESIAVVPPPEEREPEEPMGAPRSRRPGRRLVLALLGVAALCGAAAAWWVSRPPPLAGPPLRVGMIPFLPEQTLLREWSPLLRVVERKLGRPVKLVLTHSYRQMVDALVQGEVDVADLSAYPYVLARRRDPGIQLLAATLSERGRTYQAYVVVPRQAPVERLADLRGRRICYIDRTSTSGYLMPRLMLRRAGLDPRTFFASHQFSGDHYRALRDLLAGRCDAAAVASSSYHAAGSQGIAVGELRVLARSQPLPYGVYCASSRLDRALARRLKQVLLGLDFRRELGRETLSDNLMLTGFVEPDRGAIQRLERELEPGLDLPPQGRLNR